MAKSKKKLASSNLTDFEKLAGVILLIIYLIILPFFGGQINNGINTLLGLSLSRTLFNTICFYILFAVVVLVFHSLIGKSTAAFIKGMDRNFRTLGTALVFFYGLNEILYRISHLLWNNGTNLNDAALINDLSAAPPLTALALVFFIPVIEEILFRGLVFGWLREHSRTAAYVISCLLFAILHAWQFASFMWTSTSCCFWYSISSRALSLPGHTTAPEASGLLSVCTLPSMRWRCGHSGGNPVIARVICAAVP